MKKILVIIITMSSSFAYAGELVKGAKIVSLNNMANGEDKFSVYFEGGSGPCASTGYIQFPLSVSVSKEAHARAYSAALAAMTAGLSIKVHNYIDSDCGKAAYLRISK